MQESLAFNNKWEVYEEKEVYSQPCSRGERGGWRVVKYNMKIIQHQRSIRGK